MIPLAQPPRKEDGRFDDWMYRLWRRISDTAGLAWTLVDKTGSNLTDIETRNHVDLQNHNTTDYYHLTQANHTDLTDGGQTSLHKHDHAAQDNLNSADYTHLTAVVATALTDGGETTLHSHKWPTVADVVDVDETVTIGANRQLIVAELITNNGTIYNSGTVYII